MVPGLTLKLLRLEIYITQGLRFYTPKLLFQMSGQSFVVLAE